MPMNGIQGELARACLPQVYLFPKTSSHSKATSEQTHGHALAGRPDIV